MQKHLTRIIATIGLCLLASCSNSNPATTQTANGREAFKIYATTGYLADAAKNVAPDANVTTMVGPGADPHTYQPSSRDIQKMQAANLVLWNGLHLEAQMTDQLTSFKDRQLQVGKHIPNELLIDWPEQAEDGTPLKDPHVWNSPKAWSHVVRQIGNKLADLNPEQADAYRDNAEEYITKIEQVTAKNRELLNKVPENQRTLVTGHDAFGYFGTTHQFDVHATDLVSTTAELSPTELSKLADLIVERKISTIFHDNQANPQAITSLKEAVSSRGWQVTVADEELYADSLGAAENVDTYLEVLSHNATAIAKALGTKNS